jgi:hypothetical protein
LNRQDIGIKESHVAADALIIREMWSGAIRPRALDIHSGVGPLPRLTTLRPSKGDTNTAQGRSRGAIAEKRREDERSRRAKQLCSRVHPRRCRQETSRPSARMCSGFGRCAGMHRVVNVTHRRGGDFPPYGGIMASSSLWCGTSE